MRVSFNANCNLFKLCKYPSKNSKIFILNSDYCQFFQEDIKSQICESVGYNIPLAPFEGGIKTLHHLRRGNYNTAPLSKGEL